LETTYQAGRSQCAFARRPEVFDLTARSPASYLTAV
jgi:hypothetical protein